MTENSTKPTESTNGNEMGINYSTARVYCSLKKYYLCVIMTIQEAQARVDAWIRQYGVRYFSELTNMAILTEEVGEVARVIARRYGDQSSKPGDDLDLADELADVMWVVMCLANQTGIDLEAALERNFAKKTSRDHHRHLQNEKLKH